MLLNNYRFDGRTEVQFAQDIKQSSIKEAEIALRLCVYIYQKDGFWPELIPIGTDYSGKLVRDNKKVFVGPDYAINHEKVEITRSDSECKSYFHEKIGKVDKCIKEKSSMVFVNGLKKFKEPLFVWMHWKALVQFTNMSVKQYKLSYQPGHNGGYTGKMAYKYNIDWFKGMWRFLPVLNDVPKIYHNIHSLVV